MFECILIDDESSAIRSLSNYVDKLSSFAIRSAYTDPVKALMQIMSGPHVDLVVLDVKMPQLSGIDLARTIRRKTSKIIFSTSYPEFGYQAFDAMADAYLLKPYGFDRFLKTIERLFPPAPDEQIFVKTTSGQLRPVKLTEVQVIEKAIDGTCLHLAESKVDTLIDLEDMRSNFTELDGFLQIQPDVIVARRSIEEVDSRAVTMSNGASFMVDPRYMSQLIATLSKM